MSLNQAAGDKLKQYEGLRTEAQSSLELRSYSKGDLDDRLKGEGVEVGELIAAMGEKPWNFIPGVELFHRRVFRQRHRGHFGELARLSEGVPGRIGLHPAQWAGALMGSGTSKGFHIHPPHIPVGTVPAAWFQKLFVEEPDNYGLRLYSEEQWDMMFFVQGNAEIFLVDEREGMPRRRMRFIIDGDDVPGPNNAGVVIPPGVAHGIRAEGSRDLIMIYGTTTTFRPDFEGRIASGVESAPIDADWQAYFS